MRCLLCDRKINLFTTSTKGRNYITKKDGYDYFWFRCTNHGCTMYGEYEEAITVQDAWQEYLELCTFTIQHKLKNKKST